MSKIDPQFRAAIEAAETTMREFPNRVNEITTFHYFCDGMVARECRIPAGLLLTGRIHKHDHIMTLSAGDADISDQFGNGRFQAPYTFVSMAGAKRILLTYTDVVITSYHRTDITDLTEFENYIGCDTYEDYEQFLLESDQTNKLEVMP